MKRWKLVRTMLSNVGYTTLDSVSNISITDIDSDGYIYYTDENGDRVKALYNSTSPIIVDPTTDTISFTSSVNYLAGVSGYTTTLQVKNDYLVDVTHETTFVSSNPSVVSVSGAILTAVASGTSTITATHYTTATATTSITVGQYNTTISASGGTIDPTGSGAFQVTGTSAVTITNVLTLKNQLNAAVTINTANLYFTWVGVSGAVKTYLDSSPFVPSKLTAINTIQFNRTGVANLIIYDYNAKAFDATRTGVTYAVTMV